MIRKIPSQPAKRLAVAVLLAFAITGVHSPADAESSRNRHDDQIAQRTLAGSPVMAIVSIRDQRISLYDADGGALRARVSSGRPDYDTPVGIYSVLQKQEEHYSNVYDDASMPFMQRITWSGVSLHEGQLPGYPASHGCVRLPHGFAQEIFPLTKLGMRVIVARDDVAPVEISHPLLLKPGPLVRSAVATNTAYEVPGSREEDGNPFQPDVRNWPARQAELDALKSIAAAKAAEAEPTKAPADELKRATAAIAAERAKAAKALRSAQNVKRAADESAARAERALAEAKSPAAVKKWEAAKTKAGAAVTLADSKLAAAATRLQSAEEELQRATKASDAAEATRAAAFEIAREAERKTLPVSIFISLKTQRLYVRQGHEPVIDVPVLIAEPERPIGTHVFTAVDYLNGGKDLRWTAVSLVRPPAAEFAELSDRNSRRFDSDAEPTPTNAAAAAAVLDRLTLPPEIVARVSASIWPGSSLIVSDEPFSKETGKATDFVVLISTEPQGGIKRRPRQPPMPMFDRYNPDYYVAYDRYGRTKRMRQRPFFSWW